MALLFSAPPRLASHVPLPFPLAREPSFPTACALSYRRTLSLATSVVILEYILIPLPCRAALPQGRYISHRKSLRSSSRGDGHLLARAVGPGRQLLEERLSINTRAVRDVNRHFLRLEVRLHFIHAVDLREDARDRAGAAAAPARLIASVPARSTSARRRGRATRTTAQPSRRSLTSARALTTSRRLG